MHEPTIIAGPVGSVSAGTFFALDVLPAPPLAVPLEDVELEEATARVSRLLLGVTDTVLHAVDLKGGVSGEGLNVAVRMEDGERAPNRSGADEAVDQPPHRLALPTTRAIQSSSLLVVNRLGGNEGCSSEEPPQIGVSG
jgi:hypothetical protein